MFTLCSAWTHFVHWCTQTTKCLAEKSEIWDAAYVALPEPASHRLLLFFVLPLDGRLRGTPSGRSGESLIVQSVCSHFSQMDWSRLFFSSAWKTHRGLQVFCPRDGLQWVNVFLLNKRSKQTIRRFSPSLCFALTARSQVRMNRSGRNKHFYRRIMFHWCTLYIWSMSTQITVQ